MVKRKPTKPIPMTRAGRALRNPPPVAGEGVDAASTPRRRGKGKKVSDTKLGAAIGDVLGAPLVRKRKRPTFRKLVRDVAPKLAASEQEPVNSGPRFTFPPYVPPTSAPQPAIGAFRIDHLRQGQCRFACTADKAPRDQHRFCGAKTHIGPGNRWGSWCPQHLLRMFDPTTRMAKPAFLKNAERSGNR